MALAISSSRILASSRKVTSGTTTSTSSSSSRRGRSVSHLRTPPCASGSTRLHHHHHHHHHHQTLLSSQPLLMMNHRRSSIQIQHTASFSSFSAAPKVEWIQWEILASTVLAVALSGSLLLGGGSHSLLHYNPSPGNIGGGGGGGSSSNGGGPSMEHFHALMLAAPNSSASKDGNDETQLPDKHKLESDQDAWLPWRMNEGQRPYEISTRTDQGDRAYMEDEYLIKEGGRFAAVFDGHGGSDVSRYLRQNLYSKLQDQRKRKQWEDQDTPNYGSLSSHVTALRRAFEQVDREVCAMDNMCHQGSTAVAVSMHEEKGGRQILLSANVGDSRAVLCRNGLAVDLTRDHKPNCDRERARLEAMGETVEYDPLGQCWRVRNLSLSRAIGDKTSKPAVTGQVEIQQFAVTDGDEFIILGSDGLWDVMSSQDAVTFVRNRLNATPPTWDGNELERIAYARRMTMSKELVQEALKNSRKFGPAADNICVVIVWLNKNK